MQIAKKFEISELLNFPCADISYQYQSKKDAELIVLMHFSRVLDGCKSDLELTFKSPLALQWEEESYGLIDLPDNLPRCTSKGFETWAYPTMIISGSIWASSYADRINSDNDPRALNVTHFALVAMNDLLHILSGEKPLARLIGPTDV
jgi:hypothetical protein